ncbi:hypothetical protein GMOD_00000068 [Pyrenophora seminiperda CCB06]|uniref:Uncharacterized protein n=1 Tax=Pyrenophora seminiperda CCB06 TaxID=1302712 RepID=A0A3M7M6B3_9PLEO|nr:hypothetical protein GMOD_00000068 [Pyrenophora seminiperda CCB06]
MLVSTGSEPARAGRISFLTQNATRAPRITDGRHGRIDLALWHRQPGSVRSSVTGYCKRTLSFDIYSVMLLSRWCMRMLEWVADSTMEPGGNMSQPTLKSFSEPLSICIHIRKPGKQTRKDQLRSHGRPYPSNCRWSTYTRRGMLHVVPVRHWCWRQKEKKVDTPLPFRAEDTPDQACRQEIKAGLSGGQAVYQGAIAEGASEAAYSRGGRVNRVGGRQTCAVGDTACSHIHGGCCAHSRKGMGEGQTTCSNSGRVRCSAEYRRTSWRWGVVAAGAGRNDRSLSRVVEKQRCAEAHARRRLWQPLLWTVDRVPAPAAPDGRAGEIVRRLDWARWDAIGAINLRYQI